MALADPGPSVPVSTRRRFHPRSIVFTYALLAAVAWFAGSWVALRILGFYPPTAARPFFFVGWFGVFLLGLLVAHIAESSERRGTACALAVVAFVIPVIAASSVPGIAQPREYEVPGRPWLALDAAPDGSFDLYVYKGDAEHVVPLGETPWIEEDAIISPDQRHIAYASNRYGTYDLFVADLRADGTGIRTRRLTDTGGDEREPEWSPDGTRIVFLRTTEDGSALESIRASGGPATVIPAPAQAANPAWSPDGRRLTYAAPHSENSVDYDIWVADADGSHPRDTIEVGPDDWAPEWSPDGSQIVFNSGQWPYTDVYVANADGSGVRRLTASPGQDFVLWWSPDGSKIIFGSARSRTGGNFVYMMNPDGSDVQLVKRI
jgi:dipeptidyl aminopeptidase/acylaminoacyl peptidase